jgi:hypothetical protein
LKTNVLLTSEDETLPKPTYIIFITFWKIPPIKFPQRGIGRGRKDEREEIMDGLLDLLLGLCLCL